MYRRVRIIYKFGVYDVLASLLNFEFDKFLVLCHMKGFGFDRISVGASRILLIWEIQPQQNLYISNIYDLLQTEFYFTRF